MAWCADSGKKPNATANWILCCASARRSGQPVRTLFQGLFESFLERRNLTVMRYEPVRCSKCGHLLDRSVVRQSLEGGKIFRLSVTDCGERLTLPKAAEPIQLSRDDQDEGGRAAPSRRTTDMFRAGRFPRTRLCGRAKDQVAKDIHQLCLGCAPSKSTGLKSGWQSDLQKAGIGVILDRWDNAQIGASVPRFIERIEK